jgi:hypothetical protein
MSQRAPSALHTLALYVLHRMQATLAERHLTGNPWFDHRQQFEEIAFLAAEALRTGAPALDLGLQTVFKPIGSCRLETIQTVVGHCVENGWLKKPSPASAQFNYDITAKGMRWVQRLLDAEKATGGGWGTERILLLGQAARMIVDQEVRRWSGRPPTELQREIRSAAGRAFTEPVVVPHYDLSDLALQPFLEGVALRVTTPATGGGREPANSDF